MKKFLLLVLLLPAYTCHGGGNNPGQDMIPLLLATAQTLLTIHNNQDPEILVNQERREKVARKKANARKRKELARKQKLENTHRSKKAPNNSDFKKPHR